MSNSTFCLDIGERYTKIADIKKVNDSLEINAIGKADTNEYFYSTDVEKNIESESQTIKKLVEGLKINTRNINIVIPGSFTYSQLLVMPNLNEKELISAIKYQADQFIPMPIEETNIDLEIIDEYKEQGKLLILIVAAPKKLIEKVQTTVELAGLIPESIENELSASSRFISTFNKNLNLTGNSGVVVANFGLNSTTLSFFEGDKKSLLESHTFAIGYHLFLKEVQINTDTDVKKAAEILLSYDKTANPSYPVDVIAAPLIKEFVSEIKRFIVSKKVSNIYLFNEIFLFPYLTSFVKEELKVETSELNPYTFANKNPLVDSYKNELSVYVSTFGGDLR